MKYGIITSGSRGDVQPFISLALTLIQRGHEVTLVAPENFQSFVEGYGIKYLPVTGDVQSMINSPKALKILQGGSLFKFFYHLQKMTKESSTQASRDVLEACSHFDNIITAVLPLPIVYSIAEKYHKKCAVIFLSLPPIPTKEFPFHVFGTKGHPLINKASYRVTRLAYTMVSKKINTFRKEIGLPQKDVMNACLRSNMLALVAVSKELVKQPTDWPSNSHVTGFFYMQEKAREKHTIDQIPAGLEQWLQQGEQPIYIGFGSIPIPNPEVFYQVLNSILAKKRVVFCQGWSVLKELPKHPNLFVTQYINHDWLLPRCSAAIIHGGIGTVGAVMRTGIPLIIISVLADQPINGKMIEEKKIGYHIPFKQLTSARLLQAINATQNPTIKEHCKTVAATIRQEDGTGKAAQLIEAYFENTSPQ